MHRNKSSMFHFNFSPGKYDISSSYTSTIFSIVFVMSLKINSRDANEDLWKQLFSFRYWLDHLESLSLWRLSLVLCIHVSMSVYMDVCGLTYTHSVLNLVIYLHCIGIRNTDSIKFTVFAIRLTVFLPKLDDSLFHMGSLDSRHPPA